MKMPANQAAARPALAALLAVSLLSAGCSKNAREERKANDECVLSIGADPRHLDPGLVTDVPSSRAVLAIMRGLTYLDPKGNPIPELAESWTHSDDFKVWEFKLRPSKWTNGETVTSEDFLYAWLERNLKPAFASEYSYFLYVVENAQEYFEGKVTDPKLVGVEALGPDRLRVRLTGPTPYFLQLTAHHAFFPVYRGIDKADPGWPLRAETYVGNGPFKMAEFTPGDKIVLDRFDGYWNAGGVAMKRLTFRFIEEESTERIAFENGEVDGTYNAPRPDLQELEKTGTLRLPKQVGTYYLSLNVEKEVFKDVRVRKALALAVDRVSIVRNVTRANERIALGLTPVELYDTPPVTPLEDAAFDKARGLLAEAGFPGGKGFPTIHYIYNTQDNHRAIAQVVQAGWKKELGIDLKISNMEFKSLIDKRRSGDFEIARSAWIADFMDPVNFLDMFTSDSGNNDPHYKDPKFDELVKRIHVEGDAKKRMALMREAEEMFMAACPIVPLYYYSTPHLCATDLEGYDVNPMSGMDVSKLRWKK